MLAETIAKRTESLKPRGWYITPEGKFKSKYLQSIGNYIDLKEKTYRDIGFWYEPN